jgi:hypothetical protein
MLNAINVLLYASPLFFLGFVVCSKRKKERRRKKSSQLIFMHTISSFMKRQNDPILGRFVVSGNLTAVQCAFLGSDLHFTISGAEV